MGELGFECKKSDSRAIILYLQAGGQLQATNIHQLSYLFSLPVYLKTAPLAADGGGSLEHHLGW